MPRKAALKTSLLVEQENTCALSGVPLPVSLSLVDTDRKTPKAEGGIYTQNNTRIVDPVEHMKRHGIYRERTSQLSALKSLFDDRVQVMKLVLKINNQLLAYERRTDDQNPETANFLREELKRIQPKLDDLTSQVKSAIVEYDDPLVRVALQVPSLGPISVTALTVYVDLSKAPHPSSLWKYAGLHCPSGDRYQKNVAGGGNKTLRTCLFNTAESMMKNRNCAYREIYDRVKSRLEISEKVVKTRGTKGKDMECAWKDTKPSHRHGAALRAIMKHVLADYWLVGRTLLGLSTDPTYAESMLGHTHIISPWDRGWDLNNQHKEVKADELDLELFS